MGNPNDAIHILHVDDEPDFADVAATYLQREDDRFVIDSATSPDEGLRRLRSERFDCVVSDYDMPTQDGIEFLEAVREEYPDLPFILYTGKGDEAVASEAIAAGVTRYIQKQPETHHYELLANRIVRAVEEYRANRKLKRQQSKTERLQELLERAMAATDTYAYEWDFQTDTITRYPTPDPIYGMTNDELDTVYDNFPEPIHPDDRESFMEVLRRAADHGEDYQIECRVKTDDDSWRWVRDRTEVRVDDDGNPLRAIGVVTDIHEQKTRERELKQHKERLEKFTAVVSHDLRNPLQVARGRLELATEECDSPHLEAVADAHERIEQLIHDLLTSAREDGVEATERIDLEDFVEDCWKTVATRNAELRIEVDRTIRAEPARLRQVFENLIRNAVDHGSDDVTITVGELDDGFYVEDDGPGISADEHDEVFEVGYSTSETGTGFGLGIVKQIVEAHDWVIRITDSAAGGARFEITGVEFAAG